MQSYKYQLDLQSIPIAYIIHRCVLDGIDIYRTLYWIDNKWFNSFKMPTEGAHTYFLYSEEDELLEVCNLLPLIRSTYRLFNDSVALAARVWSDQVEIEIPEPIYV